MKKVLLILSIVVATLCLLFFFVWFLVQEKVIDNIWLLTKMTLLYQSVLIALMVAIVFFVFTCPRLGDRSIRK